MDASVGGVLELSSDVGAGGIAANT